MYSCIMNNVHLKVQAARVPILTKTDHVLKFTHLVYYLYIYLTKNE